MIIFKSKRINTMTTTTIQEDVKEFMRGCVEAGDCVNPSMLAEAACDEFDAWDEDDYVPLGFFEWAYEVIYEDEPAIEDDYAWIRTGC
jgi:hypothetical protein